MNDGKVIRTEIKPNTSYWAQVGMKAASEAKIIISVTPYGRGKTVKNCLTEKIKYFTRKEMVMLSLQAELL